MTLVANARYLLMSCALSQKLAPETCLGHPMLADFDVTDEIFGVSIAFPGRLNPFYTYGAMAVAIPGWALGTFLGVVVGNVLPVPFIVVYIRRIFLWMRRRLPWLNSLVDKLERKAHLKGQKVNKYKYLGLMLFVAIPLPGTGAWTGSLAAAFLDMPLRKALPSVILGVLIAGMAVSILSYGVVSLF